MRPHFIFYFTVAVVGVTSLAITSAHAQEAAGEAAESKGKKPFVDAQFPAEVPSDSKENKGTGVFAPTEVVKRAGDYAHYRLDFEAVCKHFEADGRKEFFFSVLTSMAEYDKECLDCRPMFKLFSAVCKPKYSVPPPNPEPADADAAPEEESPDSSSSSSSVAKVKSLPRLPSLETDDLISDIMRRLADNKVQAPETMKAIDKLSAALLKAENSSPAQREYAEAVASFMQAPFTEVRADVEKAERKAAKARGVRDSDGTITNKTKGLFDP